MERQTLLDLIPAYALGALDAEDHAAVEALLQTDAEARQLLAEYQVIADNLVIATPARRAPAHLQDDLRRRLAMAKPSAQENPVPLSPPRPTEISFGRTQGEGTDSSGYGTKTPEITVVRRRNVWPMVAGLAAALVVIVGALLLLRPAADPGEQLYAQIVAQADARRIPITTSEGFGANGELVMTADGAKAVIQVESLPSISAEQTFQLWLVDANGARSGGLIKSLSTESTYYIVLPLEKPALDYAGFGVSIEPAGGSPDPNGPTGPRVFGVSI